MYIYVHRHLPFPGNSSPDEALAFSRSRFAHRGNPGQGGAGGSSKVIFFFQGGLFSFGQGGLPRWSIECYFFLSLFLTQCTIIYWFGLMLLAKGLNSTYKCFLPRACSDPEVRGGLGHELPLVQVPKLQVQVLISHWKKNAINPLKVVLIIFFNQFQVSSPSPACLSSGSTSSVAGRWGSG